MRKTVLFLFLVFALFTSLNAQEDKFKAIFIFNFTKLIEWPAASIKESFVVGVMENDNLYSQLSTMLTDKKIGGIPIKIRKIQTVEESVDCQIVVLKPVKKITTEMIAQQIADRPVLLISDKSGDCAEGASICFTIRNGNLNFEISKTNFAGHNLEASSDLFNLGIKVD